MKLKEYLKKNGITEMNFAEMLGCKQPTISRYVNNLRLPRGNLMKKIQEITLGEVNYNDFIKGDNSGKDATH